MIYIIFITAAVVAVSIYGWVVYNCITQLTNSISEAWANVAVSIKKRHTVVPRLISAAKGSRDYEMLIQKSQVALRDQNIQALSEVERRLQREIVAVAEAYPDMKSSAEFKKLFEALVAIEDEIQGNRRLFNRAVALYLRQLSSFPSGVFAVAFGFTKLDFFEVDPSRLN